MRPVLLACALCVLANAGAVELTRENYDALTAGKTVFVKAFAPWNVEMSPNVQSVSLSVY